MEIKKVLSRKIFKAGYELRKELWDMPEVSDCKEMEMKAAYGLLDGGFIGTNKDAYNLVVKRGILPQKIDVNHNVCSIGYSPKNGKWYGWSHRAICGFKIGSTCKKGDIHYEPKNKKEFIQFIKNFYKDAYTYETTKDGVKITLKDSKISHMEFYPKEWGKGEWKAESMEDAKQMAIAFANSVS